MTVENSNIQRKRGGCLDSLVKVVTLNKFGVETSIILPNDRDVKTYQVIETMFTQSELDYGEPVCLVNTDLQKLKRRIVRNG